MSSNTSNNSHTLVQSTNGSQSAIFSQIQIIEGILGLIASVIAIVWIFGPFRIRITQTENKSYIDIKSKEFVQNRTFLLKWGVSIRKIYLPKPLSSDAIVKISNKPALGPRDILKPDHYQVDKKRNKKKVRLIDKDYFKSEEVEEVYVYSSSGVSENKIDDLVNNINISENDGSVIIINNNEVEIRDYRYTLPNHVTFQNIPFFQNQNYVTGFGTEIIRGNPNNNIRDETKISLHLTLPPKHEKPSGITINMP